MAILRRPFAGGNGMGQRGRRAIKTGLLTTLAVGATTLGALGCDWSCAGDFTCELVESPCPEDPAERDVPSTCGIWVSASLGDDASPGTQAKPVRTLARAIALAVDSKRV